MLFLSTAGIFSNFFVSPLVNMIIILSFESMMFHNLTRKNFRFQGLEGPVCDWPNRIECVYSTPKPTEPPTTTPDLGCRSDDDCQSSEWCDTSGKTRTTM